MLEIFQYDFMIRAFLAGSAIAVVAPLIGTFLVVRRYSLIADTLSHVALLGVALGTLFGLAPFGVAILTSLVAAFGMERLRHNQRLSGDSILALFLSGSLAMVAVLVNLVRGFSVNLVSLLFGSITTVSPSDLYYIIGFSLVSAAIVIGFYKEFFLISLDEELAQANGLRTEVFNLVLVSLAALSVSLAIKIVGALLIGALTVIPVITAFQFRLGFSRTIILAIGFSLFSVIAGIFVSFYFGLASGGTIVLIALALFLLSLFSTGK